MANNSDQIRFLEEVISNQRQLQRLQLVLATVVFGLGIVCIAVSQWLGPTLVPDNLKQVASLGGGFLATLSSFPLKQLYDRRFKISAIRLLLSGLQRKLAGTTTPEEAAALQQRFDKLWDLGLVS
jgi:hypothetical protein